MDLKQFAPAKDGKNHKPTFVRETNLKFLLGIVRIKLIVTDKRPDFTSEEYPQKYKTETKVYIFGKKVFVHSVSSKQIGTIAFSKSSVPTLTKKFTVNQNG